MKKVKYLLGLFVLGFGLLFSSQSFADTVYIDTVVDGSISSSSSRSASYLYKFSNDYQNNPTYCQKAFFGYQLYYNGLVQFNYLDLPSRKACPAPFDGSFTLNNSVFGIDPFSSTCHHWYNRGDFYCANNYGYQNYKQPITVWLGQGNNFGNNFLFVDNPLGGTGSFSSPKYGFGAGFLVNNDVLQVQSPSSSYFRFFYNSLSGYTNPVNNFNIVSMNGSTQTGSIAWEYFYPKGTRTNYGYIVDDGQSYTKYKHFGLFDMGYSYTYGKVGQSATGLSWNQLGFRTISDAVEISLKLFGSVSFDDLNAGTGTSRLSWNGLLLLRGNQYVSFGNDDGVYILSKDNSNYSRILYEHYSCSLSNIDVIFNGGDSSQSCVKLDGGYLTYNGNTSVLPFTNGSTVYSINSVDSTYPLLYDLVNGGDGLTLVHGMTVEGSSCLYINQFSRCYGFSSDSSVNIKETYLDSLPVDSTVSQNITEDKCKNDSAFAFSNPDLCWQYTNVIFSGDSSYRYQYVCDENGVCAYKLIPVSFTGNIYIDSDGNTYYLSSGNNYGQLLGPGSEYFSGGILSSDYYNINNTGLFFKCPYPTIQYIGIPGLNLGQFDIFLPLNCFISAFQHGRTYEIFKQYGIFSSFDNPLISGSTLNHEALYMFLDFVISLALFSFILFIYRLLK